MTRGTPSDRIDTTYCVEYGSVSPLPTPVPMLHPLAHESVSPFSASARGDAPFPRPHGGTAAISDRTAQSKKLSETHGSSTPIDQASYAECNGANGDAAERRFPCRNRLTGRPRWRTIKSSSQRLFFQIFPPGRVFENGLGPGRVSRDTGLHCMTVADPEVPTACRSTCFKSAPLSCVAALRTAGRRGRATTDSDSAGSAC